MTIRKNAFKEYICKPYCRFFREGQKEDLACYGAVVARRLVKRRKIEPFEDEHRCPFDPEASPEASLDDPDLLSTVCRRCLFEAEDCDFRSASPPEGTLPCGGYILLFILKAQGLLTADDLKEVCIEQC